MIYNGTWDLGGIPQDFELKYNTNSWVGIQMSKGSYKKYKQWDIYTVSSHAATALGKCIISKGLNKFGTKINLSI
jgi:hypothetical protein